MGNSWFFCETLMNLSALPKQNVGVCAQRAVSAAEWLLAQYMSESWEQTGAHSNLANQSGNSSTRPFM